MLEYLKRRWGIEGAASAAAEALIAAWDKGHTALRPTPEQAAALSKSSAVSDGKNLKEPKPMVLRDGLLQSWLHFSAENDLAFGLRRLAEASKRKLDRKGEAALLSLYADPNDAQGRAVRLGLERGLAIITGGPGTGKTYTAACLLSLSLFREPKLRFALCAPTGKAAQRLGESVKGHALTLHRLLEWRPGEDRCGRNAERPLALDLVIVDEASMLDLLLWRALMKALPEGCRLVVLGDPGQLESIEPGRVLGSLLEAMRDCHVELDKNYRFAKQPAIGRLANACLKGVATELLSASDGLRYSPENLSKALDAVWPQVLKLALAKDADAALKALPALRILTALNDGPWGVSGLNGRVTARLLQEGHLNASTPILVSVNDPHSGLFNGDLGALLHDPGGARAVFDGPRGPRFYPASQLPDCRLAWAMTVHRSQGSEYENVLIVLPPEPHELVGRELLYTAVTRAKERVLLLASETALTAACEPKPRRESGLEASLKR